MANPMNDWNDAMQAERQRQRDKGYTVEWDRAHGVDHLLILAQDYARRGEPVKSAALIEAARELGFSRSFDYISDDGHHEWCVLTPGGQNWSGIYVFGSSIPADIIRNGRPRYALNAFTGDGLHVPETGEREIESVDWPPEGSIVAERFVTIGEWYPAPLPHPDDCLYALHDEGVPHEYEPPVKVEAPDDRK